MADAGNRVAGNWYHVTETWETMPQEGTDPGPLAQQWMIDNINNYSPDDVSGIFALAQQTNNTNFASFFTIRLFLKAGSGATEWEDGTIVNPANILVDLSNKLKRPYAPVGFWNGGPFNRPNYLLGIQIAGSEPDHSLVWDYNNLPPNQWNWIVGFLNKNSPQDISAVRGLMFQNRNQATYNVNVFCRRQGTTTNWKDAHILYSTEEGFVEAIIQKLNTGKWRGLGYYAGQRDSVVGIEHD